MDRMNGKIVERAVSFGLNESMIGIVTEPTRPVENLPSVVAINGGVLPRSGRGRIYVTLSRRLAALGYRVLRFDMSGIGDSLSRGDGLPPIEAAIQDINDALDWFVGDKGPVVLMGLCDGATLAAHRASVDARVVGAALIDPLIPRTQRYRILHLWRRIVTPTTWQEIVRGTHPVWRTMKTKTMTLIGQEPLRPSLDPNEPAISEHLRKIYQGLVDNEVDVYAIFTGGMQHRHCYREQLLDAFPTIGFNDKLRLEYFEANDHHFEWPPHRAWLLDSIEQWLTSASFGDPAIAHVRSRMTDQIVERWKPIGEFSRDQNTQKLS
jgi:pimeloyl-ACP methyl ester carboxylesterase